MIMCACASPALFLLVILLVLLVCPSTCWSTQPSVVALHAPDVPAAASEEADGSTTNHETDYQYHTSPITHHTLHPHVPVSCPSNVSSPSNPIGCILYSFITYHEMFNINALTYDHYGHTVIAAHSNIYDPTVAVYYPNGTFYKFIIEGLLEEYDTQPYMPTVDDEGYLYVVNWTTGTYGNVMVFSPYPDYKHITWLEMNDLVDPVTVSVTTVKTGKYLAVSSISEAFVYRITMNGSLPNVTVTSELVGRTGHFLINQVLSATFNPITGQLLIGAYSIAGTARIYFFDINYTKPTDIVLSLVQTWDPTNSSIPRGSYLQSVQVDSSGRIIMLDGGQPQVNMVAMYGNGKGIADVDTGARKFGPGVDFMFLAIETDGSTIFVPDPAVVRIIVLQGPYPSPAAAEE